MPKSFHSNHSTSHRIRSGSLFRDRLTKYISTIEKSAQNPVKALSVLLFISYYAPCFVTVICIAKEAGSWKWGAFSMVFNTVFAFILSILVFQVGSLLG